MILRNLRIGTRLGFGFGVILLILGMIVLIGSALNANNKDRLIQGLELTNTKSTLAGKMKNAMLEAGISMRNVGLQFDVAEMNKEQAQVVTRNNHFRAALTELKTLSLDEQEQKVVADIEALNKQFAEPFGKAIGYALAFDNENAAKIITGKIDPLSQQALREMDKLVALEVAAGKDFLEKSVKDDSKLKILQLLTGGLAMAIGALLAWLITKSITRPLNHALSVASRVAQGDLTSQPVATSADEIGQLIAALQAMNQNLAEIVGNVRAGTEAIDIASREIALGNSDLSARTENQAGSLEETAASMEELTSTVSNNANSVKQGNILVNAAAENATKGGAVVNQVVNTMTAIQNSSRQIVEIIDVINGISFQTNILALNAAVEAARAGEQGRGFAVVASEVRALAQRSAEAAKQIKLLIENSASQIEAGNKLVGEAGTTMSDIVQSVTQVAVIMSEIVSAGHEQNTGIQEVNGAIAQMDEMTQQNAALVEQAAAAAESLKNQAHELSQTVSIFRIDPAVQNDATRSPQDVLTRPMVDIIHTQQLPNSSESS